ncbi:MAG TPA: universal stress protein [Acidimicrobiales bacterium]|nr:universal stress protein [Acidimicrobiales bacterium]
MTTPRRVVVGVDGSQASARGVRWAADIASDTGAEVVAVHVLGLLAHLGPDPDDATPSQSHRDEVRHRFEEEWCTGLRQAGVAHECRLVEGSPVVALLDTAAQVEADLIVVGRRGAGGFPGLQLGSTSLQLVEHAQVPVVVVPS